MILVLFINFDIQKWFETLQRYLYSLFFEIKIWYQFVYLFFDLYITVFLYKYDELPIFI